MILRRPYLALITLTLLLPSGFITTYVIAVNLRYVYPILPFISDTGNSPPVSCIFGQFLDLSSLLLIYVAYVRYLHIKKFAQAKHLVWLNGICLALGIICAIGMITVGNFQEGNQMIVHIIGAFSAFTSFLVYTFIDIFLARKLRNFMSGSAKFTIIRVTLCSIATINLILVAVFTYIYFILSSNWYNFQKALDFRTAAAANEWCMCFLFAIMLGMFIFDFLKIEFSDPDVKCKRTIIISNNHVHPNMQS